MNRTERESEPPGLDERVRRFPAAVSAEAQALAWANQEDAPHGAAVVVTHEVSPRGRRGQAWWAPADATLACAVVLRPRLPAEEGDSVWLAGGLVAARAAQLVGDRQLRTWWPDLVVDAATRDPVAAVSAAIQLGPGQVRSAVVTCRFDLARLGLDPTGRDALLQALLGSVDDMTDRCSDGRALAAAYEPQCILVGEAVKVALRPKGETRGVVRSVDRLGRLVLQSATGMAESVPVDAFGNLEIVRR